MNFIVRLIITSLAIFLIANLMPGVEVTDMSMAILVSIVLILLNMFVKPILVFLTLPITVITLGFFLLVINALIILTASELLGAGFKVNGFWVAMLFSIILSMTTSLLVTVAKNFEKTNK
jgi:putative membrane protein